MGYRIEHDSMGEVRVPDLKYWGAYRPERSRNNFKIGREASMPKEIIKAFAYVKKAAAEVNHDLGVSLSSEKKEMIVAVCDEILQEKLDDHFPLVIWQQVPVPRPI